MKKQRQSVALNGAQFNFSITPEQMAIATVMVDAYSIDEKLRRIDDIHAAQPALLGAAVQLPSQGVDLKTADHAFHVLLVLFECFSMNVPTLPRIESAMVQQAFDDIAQMLRLYDGKTVAEATRLQAQWLQSQKEHLVLAFVVDYLGSRLREATREQELVRNCCLAMTNACLAAYDAMP